MKIPKLPDNVKVHEAAWQAIRAIDAVNKALAARIVHRIAALGADKAV